jgi:hypothetical protein
MAKYIEDSVAFLGYLINLVLQNDIPLIKTIFSKHIKILLANFEVFLPIPKFLKYNQGSFLDRKKIFKI